MALLCYFSPSGPFSSFAQQTTGAHSRVIGRVSEVSGNALTVKTDAGLSVTVTAAENARILRTVPGQKTLAGASPIGVSDIAVGDRVLMVIDGDGSAPTAGTIIVNKQADLAEMERDQQADWKRRGVGGIVKSVDRENKVITLASGNRTITVKVTPSTIFRRYTSDSVKFSDAKASTIDEIHSGDQATARGNHSVATGEVTAEEIVSGSFRSIAGRVISIDSSASTITVKDLLTKKQLVIHVVPDSDLRKLDSAAAATVAKRLSSAETGHQGAGIQSAPSDDEGAEGQNGGSVARLLQRAPPIHIADLRTGDAVIIVATQGNPDSATAIRLVAGVEPMLAASASGSESVFSSAWSLGGGSPGDAEAGQGNP